MILLPDNSQRGKNTIIAFYLLYILQIFGLVSGFMQYLLLVKAKKGAFVQQEAEANDLRQQIVIYTHLAMYIVCIVLFIMWFRRAYNNLNVSDKARSQYAEGWAAGAWFVPFLNLGRPYLIMQEIWEKTQQATNGLINYLSSSIVGWWWALWIIFNVCSNIINKVFTGNSIDDLLNNTIANLGCDVIELGALTLIIVIVKKVMVFEANLQQSLLVEEETEGEDKLNFIL
jgi:Domain of unknown function (DUF4328)